MPEFLQLNIFPPGALQSSVITTVWVGVCVVVFLNARFGSTLAGLVVPGYLVPLFFVKPVSAMVVVFEAYLTYGLAYLLANKVLVKMGYSEMFGRDRFFALILLSVLVRIVLDFFLIPLLLEHSGGLFANYDLKNNLQSFGLIIVALIANQMWMGGVVKGSRSLFLYLGLTWALIAWVLIPLTNFNIGGLNYMYEDLATSLLSSPKAYIILLTTAFIASRMNLQFGWEFNGILIPALLALQWYQPEKLLFTFVEAGVILALGTLLMRLPLLKGITFEGGRLLLLFFNVSFIYKILLGFAFIEFFPEVKISDYYGFGYVVSTLIAIKVFQKHIALKMAVSTLFTSLVGIGIATVAGFLLTLTSNTPRTIDASYAVRPLLNTEQTVSELYNAVRPSSFFSNLRPTSLTDIERNHFQEIVELINVMLPANRAEILEQVNHLANQISVDMWLTENDILVLHKLGIGFYAIRLSTAPGIILEVTRARAELGSATLGLSLFNKADASAIFIDLSYQLQSSGNYVFDSGQEDGFFQTLHRAFAQHNVLQISGQLKETEQRKRLRQIQENASNQLTILKSMPHHLPLELLNNVVRDIEYRWLETGTNPQWQHDGFGIAQLRLNNREMRSALARVEVYKSANSDSDVTNMEGYLITWLLERKKQIARKGSDGYVRPGENELLFWHQDILIPFMSWLRRFELNGWTEQARNELQRLNLLAESVGYEFQLLKQPVTNKEFLIFQELSGARGYDLQRKNWATLVVNLTAQKNHLIQVPNPFFEKTSFEFGSALFTKLQNRFLLLSGTHPWANPDGSSNVTLEGNKHTLYHVMFMAIIKEFRDQQIIPIQVRGFSFQESRPFPAEHALISLWRNINQLQLSEPIQTLMSSLDDYGVDYRFVDGDFVTSAYYLSNNQQIDFLNYQGVEDFVTLWISPLMRDSFKATDAIKIEEQHARLLGLDVVREDIRRYSLAQQTAQKIPLALTRQLSTYAKRRNVHNLQRAINVSGELKLSHLLDSSSLQQFIVIKDKTDSLLGAFNLNSLNQKVVLLSDQQSLERFVNARYRWLLPSSEGVPDS